MQLEEMERYKNTLMKDLLTNKKIVDLIMPDGKHIDPLDLRYKQVFPFEYLPDTVEDGKTFICFDVELSRVRDKTFYQSTIYVWIFTHKTLLRMDGGGLRIDRLCSEVAKQMNGSRYYGLGQLDLMTSKRFAPMMDYQGKCLMFQSDDFNRLYNPNQKVPNNRRLQR